MYDRFVFFIETLRLQQQNIEINKKKTPEHLYERHVNKNPFDCIFLKMSKANQSPIKSNEQIHIKAISVCTRAHRF